MSESFATLPMQNVIPAYVYQQYSDDVNVQAFAASFNSLAQSYLEWFNNTPLAVYTSSGISGPLLDWIGTGIYGIARPTISTSSVSRVAGFGTGVYGYQPAYGEQIYSSSGTASIATDDIYKRVMTWHLYKGDGEQFSIQWLKNRVARFLYGVNGSDFAVLNDPPSVTVSGSTFTITMQAEVFVLTDSNGNPIVNSSGDPLTYAGAISPEATIFQQCVNDGILALPFQYNFTVVT